MLIHYIEDNERDARLIKLIAGSDTDLNFRISTTLSELTQFAMDKSVDCILLDVQRPDAVSLEDDIRKVRALTDAPIIFITGGDVDALRNDAMRAGAEAVLEKATLSSGVLKQIFWNAKSRSDMARSRAQETGDPELEVPAPSDWPNYNLNVIDLPLMFVETTIINLRTRMSERDATVMQELQEVISSLRSYSRSDLSRDSRISLAETLSSIREEMEALATARDMTLLMHDEPSWHTQMGSANVFLAGLKCLLRGYVLAGQAGDRMFLRLEKTDCDAKLVMTTSRNMLDGAHIFFPHNHIAQDLSLAALCFLQTGALLLGLREQQIEFHTGPATQQVIIHL